ncbi:hypothetical protein BDD43_1993 [Mucilaginibacter gracilis]|uniref:Uncharacterized protein n=2 Tax=Mucilaginibacter gracilis TaxID=423350 RepID=A0A495IYQ4_9SPHI|nr:hypothetical protein BDD43_1993 [Mucilaginibacter gracilis]
MSPWKKALLYFLCLLILTCSAVMIILACGPEPDPYDYGVSFFHNNISGGKAYRAFYFTSSQSLYDVDEPVNEQDVNAWEWASYLKGRVKASDVKKVMYQLNHPADSVLLQGYLNLNRGLPDSLKRNTFLPALRKNKAALLYYRFVKIIEPAVSYKDPWRSEPADTAYLLKNATYALKEASSVKDQFLKTRYYYQAQRLFHYTGQNKRAIDIYEKQIANARTSYYIKGLTLGLRAGEEWRTGDPAKSAYQFSKLFTGFPERRIQAYQNYVANKVPESEVIAFARSNDEKAVVYAMNGFYTPRFSTKYLKKVYQTAPRSPFVEILLAREVNKLEAGYLTPKLTDHLPYDNLDGDYYGWNDSLKKAKNMGKYISELGSFCTMIAKEKKCRNPQLGMITKAYLEWMTGKNAAGFTAINEVDDAGLAIKMHDQKQLVKLLLITQKIKRLDSAAEQELAPSLSWLDQKVKQESITNGERIKAFQDYGGERRLQRFTWSARDVYQKLLAPMYLSRHDTTKAALSMLKGMPKLHEDTLACYHQNYWNDYTTINFWQNYLHSSNFRQLISYKKYKKKGENTPYAKILTSGLKRTSFDCLYNLLGTAYLREHNYQQAVSVLSQIKKYSPKDFPLEYYNGPRLKSNPFVVQLNDYPKNYHQGKRGGYSKYRFAKTMYNLQMAVKRNPQKAARYTFAMATGLYNTSRYGNAWFMIAYAYSDSWIEKNRREPLYYDQDLNKTIDAEKLFLKARQLSNDPEFKGQCTFMAAKCKQNRYKGADDEFVHHKYFQGHADPYQDEIRRNPYFTELRKSYSRTRFYQVAVHECSYFRDFLASAHTSKKKQQPGK